MNASPHGTATPAASTKPPRRRRAPGALLLPLLALLAAAGIVMHLIGPARAAEPLDLVTAFALAEENDPEFRAVGAAREAALQNIAAARAALRPNVALGSGANANARDSHPTTPNSPDDDYLGYNLSLDLTHPLHNPLRDLQLEQARTGGEQATTRQMQSRQQLMVRVAASYFAVLNASDNERFARTNREAIAQQLRQAQERHEVGLIPITGVEEAKARFDLATAREIESTNALDNAREALREIIGLYPEALATLDDAMPLTAVPPDDIDEWIRVALESNLQLKTSQFQVTLAENAIELADAGDAPTVNLVGSADGSGAETHPRARESIGSQVGLQLRIPLYTGGLVQSRVREAEARLREATHRHEQVRRAVERATRESYLGVASAIARGRALAQAVVSSESALAAVEAGFDVGTRTSVDVLDAQRDLFQARNELVAARYDYINNTLRLRQAAGTLATDDLDAINAWLK